MKKQCSVYETVLCAGQVDACTEKVREFLRDTKLDSKDISRYSLSVDEILLKELENGKEGADVKLKTGVRFTRPFISLEISGAPSNVYSLKNTQQSVLGDSILRNIGISPEYAYSDGANIYTFRIKKKSLSPFAMLIIALIAALAAGFAGLLLPDGIRGSVLDSFLTPLHDTFLNVLGCIAGPMVFLSVAWGIYGIGDAATLKQVGKRMLFGYIGTVYAVVIIIGWMAVPLFSFDNTGAGGGTSELSSIFTMLLGIIPKNIFSPFVDGNTLQIIFLAVVIGIAMLFLGQKTGAVAKAVEQINYIVQFLIEFISRLVPYFIFIVIVKMIWSDTLSVFLGVGRLFLIFGGTVILMVVGVVGYTSLKNRLSPWTLIKKGLPTLIVAITTASSAAAFGTNTTICRKKLGISDTVTSFGIPLGIVTFKPTTALSFTVISMYFAESYGIKVSLSWFVIMMFAVGILALATPPIPGGAMTAYTVLFALIGVPAEALAVALTCDTIFDFICTGFDQFLMQYELLNQAGKLGMVDEKILKKAI